MTTPSNAVIVADDGSVYVFATKEGIRLGAPIHGVSVEANLTPDAASQLRRDLQQAIQLHREYQSIL